jgi:putative membrane protein
VAFAQADRENRNRGQGQGITADDLAKAMTPPADSKQFAMRAAEGNLFEIRLAELAEQKSQSQEVKRLAQMLRQDHQQAQDQLKQAAQSAQVNIPTDLPPHKQTKLQAFQQLEGKVFDNAFTMSQIESHLKSIMMYQNEAQNGTDQQIKQYAQQTGSKLRQHAQHVIKVAQGMQIPVEAIAAGGAGAGDAARPAGGTIRGDTERDQSRPRTGTGADKPAGTSGAGQDRDK